MNNFVPPPNAWTQMSKKKKTKYLDAMTQLYGDKNAKESKEHLQPILKEETQKV